ncbi:hypothetical protein GIB67_022772 [Kingdonia uniflora]|uniref:Uncharacterized protein n=1 Tax=Kingdonia uniflora TaxID=39325 RepID=A0A7J7N806_9MAGN|nr:hypothetical protein GIB67_022772 [Kingdonia uniflora]
MVIPDMLKMLQCFKRLDAKLRVRFVSWGCRGRTGAMRGRVTLMAVELLRLVEEWHPLHGDN